MAYVPGCARRRCCGSAHVKLHHPSPHCAQVHGLLVLHRSHRGHLQLLGGALQHRVCAAARPVVSWQAYNVPWDGRPAAFGGTSG
jgi:hypothetical protein